MDSIGLTYSKPSDESVLKKLEASRSMSFLSRRAKLSSRFSAVLMQKSCCSNLYLSKRAFHDPVLHGSSLRFVMGPAVGDHGALASPHISPGFVAMPARW